MADSRIQELENELRARLRRFVGDKSKWCAPRHQALQKIRESERYAFLLGGAVRDILLSQKPNSLVPRDLDIVLGYAPVKKVAASFPDCRRKWNCYGGVSIEIKDWSLDIWSLQKTWAFQKKHVEGKSFRDLTKTTFLDIEAVAVELFSRKGQKRTIYSNGFFEAILNKTIEINLEDNPNPRTCIIRALRLAKKFKFAIGPKLAKYIVRHTNQIGIEELAKAYRLRYGDTGMLVQWLQQYINAIRKQLRVSDRQPVKLPRLECQKNLPTRLWSSPARMKSYCLFTLA